MQSFDSQTNLMNWINNSSSDYTIISVCWLGGLDYYVVYSDSS